MVTTYVSTGGRVAEGYNAKASEVIDLKGFAKRANGGLSEPCYVRKWRSEGRSAGPSREVRPPLRLLLLNNAPTLLPRAAQYTRCRVRGCRSELFQRVVRGDRPIFFLRTAAATKSAMEPMAMSPAMDTAHQFTKRDFTNSS